MTAPRRAMTPRVRCVLAGRVQTLGSTTSGIDKKPVGGPCRVERLGLAGDEQADLRAHGGEFKAVHCYAWSHYEQWRREQPGQALFDQPGAFGENLSLDGIDEAGVCIGDRWRIGSALFTLTQGRQPCFKLNLRFAVADMAAQVQLNLRTGWYFGVHEPGWVQAGDACELVARPHPGWTVARLLALIRDRETRPEVLDDTLALPLPPSWRRLFERRLQSGQIEEWQARLQGPQHPRQTPWPGSCARRDVVAPREQRASCMATTPLPKGGLRANENAQPGRVGRAKAVVVAKGGIEPPTRGFSVLAACVPADSWQFSSC